MITFPRDEAMTVAGEQERFEALRQILHRGGAWAHYVINNNEAIWFEVDKPVPVPAGKRTVFFTVNPCRAIPPTNKNGVACDKKYRHSQNDYVAAINCLYAEWDDKDYGGDMAACLDHIESLPDRGVPLPSTLSNSGGGYQGYWLLDEPFYLDSDEAFAYADHLQKAWVVLVNGDRGVNDVRRILRVPGSWNVKPKYGPEGRLCHFEWQDTSLLYSLDELAALVPPPEPEPDRSRLEEYAERIKDRVRDDTTDAAVDRYIEDALDREYNDLKSLASGGRSRALVIAAMRLGGISKSDWGSSLTASNIESTLLRAATANGLVNDYGERDIKREIANGIRYADATIMPNLKKLYPEMFEAKSSNGYSSNGGPPEPPPPPPPEGGEDEGGGVNLLAFDATDAGNTEAVLAVRGKEFLYVKVWGWLAWTGTHWSVDGAEERAHAAVIEVLRARRMAAVGREIEAIVSCSKPNRARVNACLEYMTKMVSVLPSEFDTEPLLLNVANGVVNLATGELVPHDISQRFTYCVPVEYDPDAECPEWLTFLSTTIGGGTEMLDYLQEAVGYSLTGLTREECLFYIHGPTRSGKGTFTETLLSMMGRSPLAAEVDFSLFTQPQNADAQNFALAPLRPCRSIFASESNKYEPLNEARVKSITGGNEVYCAFKGKGHFNYRPQFKIWLSSNHPPRGDVDDDALWRSRIKVVEFPTSHVGTEDKGLKARLTSPESLRGILAWAVAGAVRWANRPTGLQHPEQVTAATQAARDALDTVKQWLEENTEHDADAFTSNAMIQTNYENWCKAHGHKPKGGSTLGRALSAKGYEADRRYLANSSQRVRGFIGLRLVESKDEMW